MIYYSAESDILVLIKGKMELRRNDKNNLDKLMSIIETNGNTFIRKYDMRTYCDQVDLLLILGYDITDVYKDKFDEYKLILK